MSEPRSYRISITQNTKESPQLRARAFYDELGISQRVRYLDITLDAYAGGTFRQLQKDAPLDPGLIFGSDTEAVEKTIIANRFRLVALHMRCASENMFSEKRDMPNLKRLTMSGRIDNDQELYLPNAPELEEVELFLDPGCRKNDLDMIFALKQYPKLRSVHLSNIDLRFTLWLHPDAIPKRDGLAVKLSLEETAAAESLGRDLLRRFTPLTLVARSIQPLRALLFAMRGDPLKGPVPKMAGGMTAPDTFSIRDADSHNPTNLYRHAVVFPAPILDDKPLRASMLSLLTGFAFDYLCRLGVPVHLFEEMRQKLVPVPRLKVLELQFVLDPPEINPAVLAVPGPWKLTKLKRLILSCDTTVDPEGTDPAVLAPKALAWARDTLPAIVASEYILNFTRPLKSFSIITGDGPHREYVEDMKKQWEPLTADNDVHWLERRDWSY